MNDQKRLSLENFKKNAKTETKSDLTKIAGGILGACHCVSYVYQTYSTSSGTDSLTSHYYN